MRQGYIVAVISVGAIISAFSMAPSPVLAGGATQIDGLALAPVSESTPECPDLDTFGADFFNPMTGDLNGCLYVIVETSECKPSGTYLETGREIFVGSYNGNEGTFETTYRFEAKYEDCPDPATEIFGRCQHPIVPGSGTGVFEGVTGRLDFKDNVEDDPITFSYRGHLRF
ncbi:DUF3224 domain-containing protein [Polyangium jinanense]|uniref:DUF3224 domain-containing protein n=1 Tax=Polyangium jinanense TaxID=2829994 RepID=A0A9X4APW2_9BACT|nr:DUF3224 domain-containing protein [Polyangium jinanense]MDC3953163.1 DUF3224 domain-containing protein [Polyangium jinanense]MDC3979716.1 DUF3224 domain-containing protein [Polyangium jinanense]